ncbi:transcription termination factor MTERF15, mitochondrial isoform X2 [Salvia miltiorrhiza]|uniref:transcription termination factor MTERF15, mitochondrial isoform X1 n=1 Tax=Salvia miltiorrhiza TaxID=226208 RepID=UPI0025AD30AE|nr:transcription termination factor MTERF15, mitochondrial isoform X1 [Salvia miltiorrhiza]XP_057805005.1 transcription termination factor MTERF15, mitochondrial isoform X2 [Salvia miltiorrhiza]
MAIRIKPLYHYIANSSISFPNLLSRSLSTTSPSHHENPTPLCNLFRRYGFPPSELPNFLKKNEFIQNSAPREIENYFKILLSLNPSREFLVSTVTSCPRVLQLSLLETWKYGINQLGIRNISSIATCNILELVSKFGLSPNDVSRRVGCLKSLGFSEATVIRVLENVPMAIMSVDDELHDKVEFLMGIGIRRSEIDRVIRLYPRILAFGVEKRLKPLLDEFGDLGFSLSDVRREVVREPQVLGLENGELSHCLEMLRSLKCRLAIKESIFRDGEFRAGYRVKLRVDCLRKHGLIYRDAFTVLWKEPRVILYDIKDVERKIDFLVSKMKFSIECLVEVPEYLGVNFDKQIVPRFNVIDHLRSRGGLGDEVGLRKLVKMSRLRFYNMYVKPYPDCEKIYGRFAEKSAVQTPHSAGMWKLFRPQKYPQTEEDVKNIRYFMESFPK